jgi:hypothetical protein
MSDMEVFRAHRLGLDPGVCRGVVVGGCLRTGLADQRFVSRSIDGHAHNNERDPAYGWICLSDRGRLFTPSGALTRVLWHEYAHLLVPNARHGRRWQEAVTALGWPSEARRYRRG